MTKVTLPDISSGYNLSAINSNFQRIEDELNNKVLYRQIKDGEPNAMSDNLDMNSNEIINVSKLSANALEIGGAQITADNAVVDPYNGTREALRRSYAGAGFNLVAGSFEAGGTLVNSIDVLLHEASGKAFSGPVGPVAGGTDPTSGVFEDRSFDIVLDLPNYAAIRLYSGGSTRVSCQGRTSEFDGGSGLFYLNASDVVSPDNGGTVLVDSLNRRWYRQYIGYVNVKWFAEGDGITDDTLAFENALAAADGGMVYVPPATYVVNNMSKPPRLEGDHANRAILICTLPNSCVLLNPAGSQHPANSVIVKNLILDTTSTNCNAYRADYAGGLSYTDSALFYNVETSQKFKASYVGNFIFSKWIYCADGKYGGAPTQIHQFLVATQYGQVNDNLFDQCRIYHSGDGNNGIKPFELYWANGNTFNKCNFEFCYGGIMKLTGGYGNAFNNCWIEIGLFPSLPTATLPTELFLLEYAASGAGAGSQPRSFTLNECIIAIGDSVNKFGLRDGGAIFKSSNGSGGEWGLINCVFYGSRPGAINLYSGAFPESRVVWNNVGNSGGIDSAISFADFWVTAKIIGQKQIEYAPRLYVIQTLQEPTYTSRKGYCVVGEKTIEVFFDINWTNLPNTGSYSLAVSLPVEIRTPQVDVYTRVIRLSGMSATINNYEIIGKLTENTKEISLHIKPANTPDTTTPLPPVHAASGRITGSLTFNTL